MNFTEKKAYVDKYINILPDEEREAFDFNFACVFTKNSVGMENGITNRLEEVVSSIRGANNSVDEMRKRALYNHYNAYLKMLDKIKKDPHLKVSEDLIKDIHKEVMNGIIEGGVYRNVNIKVNGSMYIPCDHIKLYDRMQKYINELANMPDGLEKAAYAHLYLHKLHPFLDGNGRTCRLVLNFVLIQMGYVPISIPNKRRDEYFKTLEEYKVNKNSAPFIALLQELLEKEYDRLIDLIEPFENK